LAVPIANWDWTADWLDASADPAAVGGAGVVTAAEADPTTVAHGVPCAGSNYVVWWIGELDTITSYTVEVWVYCSEAGEWTELRRDDDSVYTWTRGNALFTCVVPNYGYDRMALIVTAQNGTEFVRHARLG